MLFLESDFQVKILSVQKLSWNFNDTHVLPRPFNALSFRLKGNSDFSDGKDTTHLDTGDILFMPQNVAYDIKSADEEIIVIHFDLEGINQEYFETIRPKHPDSYRDLFIDIYSEWNNRGQGYYLKTMSYFYALLAKLSNHLPHVESPTYMKIQKSIEYMQRHFMDSSINVYDLCKLSNVSDTYFRKLFFEVYGTTPLLYINKLRVNYAAELLETGYYSIEEVAIKSGFEDPKYFSTVFKKYMNCSPSKYI